MTLTKVLQKFDETRVDDIGSAVTREMGKLESGIGAGSSIAIAVGSRGIHGIVEIVRSTVAWLKARGARPFIVPAMGSHGGATAEGQAGILAAYGIDELHVGAPIRSSMDTVPLDAPGVPARLFMDALAWKSDGVLLVNRVKPHTDFHALYESGLVKMSVLGLGKHAQALEIHRFGVHGLSEIMPLCAGRILSSGKILGGLAIVENAYDHPARIEAVPAPAIMDREPELLSMARALMPSIPVEEIDILIVDMIGKDLSGTGMDPNIIGRLAIRGEPEPERPRIRTIIARDITPESHGNALGIGFADVITRRLFEKIDFAPMYENVFTSTFLERAKVPVIAKNDAEAVGFCLRACGPIPEGKERVMRIRDTLHLGELYVSSEIKRELQGRPRVEITAQEIPLLDEHGSCPAPGTWI
jgi:hypothetical protein